MISQVLELMGAERMDKNLYKGRIVATIEARMTSTRLPGKVLMEVCNKPLLTHLVERLKLVPSLAEVVVATTVNHADDPIAKVSESLKIGLYRGSEDDVLGRVLGAAQAYGADVIVEITGDCPAIDPSIVQQCIDEYYKSGCDYLSTRYYFGGLNTQVFSTNVLAEVERITRDDSAAREHVSLSIYEHPEIYKLHYLDGPPHLRREDIVVELDTREDYEMIKTIYEFLYPRNPQFSAEDIVKYLDDNPHVLSIVTGVPRKSAR